MSGMTLDLNLDFCNVLFPDGSKEVSWAELPIRDSRSYEQSTSVAKPFPAVSRWISIGM